MHDFPGVTVRIGEITRIAAPRGPLRRLEQLRFGSNRVCKPRIDLRNGRTVPTQRHAAERGDRVTCGPLDLVVRSVDEAGNPTAVGLGVPDGDGAETGRSLLSRLIRRARKAIRTMLGGGDGT
jgi:hypothetical protein